MDYFSQNTDFLLFQFFLKENISYPFYPTYTQHNTNVYYTQGNENNSYPPSWQAYSYNTKFQNFIYEECYQQEEEVEIRNHQLMQELMTKANTLAVSIDIYEQQISNLHIQEPPFEDIYQ